MRDVYYMLLIISIVSLIGAITIRESFMGSNYRNWLHKNQKKDHSKELKILIDKISGVSKEFKAYKDIIERYILRGYIISEMKPSINERLFAIEKDLNISYKTTSRSNVASGSRVASGSNVVGSRVASTAGSNVVGSRVVAGSNVASGSNVVGSRVVAGSNVVGSRVASGLSAVGSRVVAGSRVASTAGSNVVGSNVVGSNVVGLNVASGSRNTETFNATAGANSEQSERDYSGEVYTTSSNPATKKYASKKDFTTVMKTVKSQYSSLNKQFAAFSKELVSVKAKVEKVDAVDKRLKKLESDLTIVADA